MYRLFRAGIIAAGLSLAGGCTSTSGVSGSTTAGQPGAGDAGYEYDSTRGGDVESFDGSYRDGAGFTESGFDGGGIGPSPDVVGRTIYFDYDSAEIRPVSRQVIEAHVDYLLQNPAVALLLEGHTDARGAREYNIALGERRGMAVRQLMLSLGVASRQLSVVSLGEEQPVDPGSAENSYALNRRVEIAY